MSEQMLLLELELKPVPAEGAWRRGGPAGKLGAWYFHGPSGWTVHHCGHPTANFPYYILTKDGDRVLAPNGRGFQRLEIAQHHVEEHWQ
jgi:hypothetical protein